KTGRIKKQSDLVRRLLCLNIALGVGPVAIEFFAELEVARDSVIHHGSQKSWHERGKKSKYVAARFRGPDDKIWVDQDDLNEAVNKAKEQVAWYGQKIREFKAAAKKVV